MRILEKQDDKSITCVKKSTTVPRIEIEDVRELSLIVPGGGVQIPKIRKCNHGPTPRLKIANIAPPLRSKMQPWPPVRYQNVIMAP